MSLRQRYTCSFMFKFTETETAVSASRLLYFTKAQCFVVIMNAHKFKRRVFTYLKYVLILSV